MKISQVLLNYTQSNTYQVMYIYRYTGAKDLKKQNKSKNQQLVHKDRASGKTVIKSSGPEGKPLKKSYPNLIRGASATLKKGNKDNGKKGSSIRRPTAKV